MPIPSNVIELVIRANDQATGPLNVVAANIRKMVIGGVVAGAVLGLRKVVQVSVEAQKATAQLDSAYKATGAAVGITRARMDELAASIQRTTVNSKTMVQSAEAVLLTFDKVRGQAFERTIVAATDLSERLGTGLVSATKALGLALQNPEQGMIRLRLMGIILSESQKKLIKSFIDTGQTARAQNYILSEVERRYKGAAVAARDTLGGALAGLKNSISDLFEFDKSSTKGLAIAINVLSDNLAGLTKIVLAGAAAWGVYRAALVAVGVSRAVVGFTELFMAVARGTAVLIPATVATNTLAVATTRLGGALALLGLTNPYVLLAAAIAGLGVLLYKAATDAEWAKERKLEAIDAEINRLKALGIFQNEGHRRRMAQLEQERVALLEIAHGPTSRGRRPVPVELSPLSDDQLKAMQAYLPALDQLRINLDEARKSFTAVQKVFGAGTEEFKLAARALAGVDREWQTALRERDAALKEIVVTSRRDTTLQDWEANTRTALESATKQWQIHAAQIAQLPLTPTIRLDRMQQGFDAAFANVSVNTLAQLEQFKVAVSKAAGEAGAAAERVAALIKDKALAIPEIAAGLEVMKSLRSEIEALADDAVEQQRVLNQLLAVLTSAAVRDEQAIAAVMDAKQTAAQRSVEAIKLAKLQMGELSAAGKKAAEDIQAAFANATRSLLSGDKIRDILGNFLKAIREIPAQILAEKIGDKIKLALTPKIEALFRGGPTVAKPGGTAAVIAGVLGAGGQGAQAPAGVEQPQTAIQKAAQIVAGIKERAGAQVCQCVCTCLCGADESLLGAVLDQTRGQKAVAGSNTQKVLSGVDATVKTATATISASVISSGQQVVNAVISGQGGGGMDWLGTAIKIVGAIYGGAGGAGGSVADKSFSAGGGYAGGLTMLGEEGPEAVVLPRGSRVMNQRQMAFQGGGGPMVVLQETHHITINGASDAKETRAELAGYLTLRDAKLEQRIFNRIRENGLGRMRV